MAKKRQVGIKRDGSPNQGARIVIIVRYLHEEVKGVTVSKIIEVLQRDHEINVDRRQIYRDIEYIRKGGVKLKEVAYGREKTYSIATDDRILHVSTMNQAIPLAMDMIKAFAPQAAKMNIERIADKLTGMLERDFAGGAAGKQDVLASDELMHSIHSGTWHREVDPIILADAFAAVKGRRWFVLKYGSEDAPPRNVFPCKITMYLGRMYLIAWVRDERSTKGGSYFVFPLDKILSLEQETGPKRPRHIFDADEFMKTRWGIWSSIYNPQNPSNTYNVEVRIVAEESEKHMIKEFVERRWHPSQEVKHIDDLTYRMTFESGVSPELVSWVLRWAPHVHVIKPKFLKDEVRKRAQKLMEALG